MVGRKQLAAGTVAANVLQYGTGALNIDACRIGTTDDRSRPPAGGMFMFDGFSTLEELRAAATIGARTPKGRDAAATLVRFESASGSESHTAGRWPANVILDEDQAAALDEQSGTLHAPGSNGSKTSEGMNGTDTFRIHAREQLPSRTDSGGASRFFYCAKAPKKERPVFVDADGKSHSHSTVKPLALMRWLVRLVTPPGGVVLDPFAGSGTTVEAAMLEGFDVIGIERETDYLAMIQQRIARQVNGPAA